MNRLKVALERGYATVTIVAAIVFAVAFSAVSILTSRELADGLTTMVEHPVKVSQALYGVRRATAEMEIRMGRLALYDSPGDVKIVRDAIARLSLELDRNIRTIVDFYLGPPEQTERLKSLIGRIRAGQETILDQAARLGSAQVARRTEAELLPLYRALDDLFNNEMLVFIGSTGERLSREALSILRITIGGSLIISLLMIWLAFLARRIAAKRAEDRRFRDYVLKVISENAGNVFLIYHLRLRRMEYVSPNSGPLLGVDADTLAQDASALLELLEPEPAAELGRMLESEVMQTRYECECAVGHPSAGAKTWMLLRLHPVREQGAVTRYILSLSDLTETRKTQQVLRDALLSAQNANAAKSEFLSRMSHEIRTPMNAIIGMTTIQGTGLGMAITKNILNLMNGSIRVQSAPGQGTTFTVEIAFDVENAPIQAASLETLRVLVVDDERDVCEHASIILDRMGVCGEWALSGREAVRRVIEEHESGNGFHVVFMDWKMPEMDGIEATRRIRQQVGPDTLIIIISAYDWSEIEQEARLAGADAFIAKPLFQSTIYNTLVAVTRGHASEPAPVGKKADVDLSGRRVLMVEDNALNMEIGVAFLEQAGAMVDSAFNGREAVEMFAVSALGYYDAVVMDVQMPVMDGYAATRAIRGLDRADAAAVPIVAMTANAFAEDVAAALDAGMNAHVGKPVDRDLLLRVIENELARRRAA